MKKWIRNILVTVVILFAIAYFYLIYPFWGMPFNGQRHGQIPLTPSWALETWLWEDDVNTAAYVDELLEGYKRYDIPVRTVIIDSPWSLRYNDFVVDTSRYPQPEIWFEGLQNEGYRVVLWMTSLVNSYSKDTRIQTSEDWYEGIREKGFLITDKNQNEWWKGKGGFVDYTNPQALEWWHGTQQQLFDYGIDGWKLDGAATLFWTTKAGIPFFYKKSQKGIITTREYMDLYYREEYRHGLTQNPEFVSLTRAMDGEYAHPEGFSPFDASPVNWVGDQKHTWQSAGDKEMETDDDDLVMDGIRGIETAINYTLKSAAKGYNIIGSDVAGFSGKTIPPRLYIRWSQFSAFCGLFMNGGHGERRLWKRTQEELEIIRKFSWLHNELVPYMFHYVVTAHEGGRRLQTPIKGGKYQYMFGDDLLVAPIYVDSKRREISLSGGEWRYFFDDKESIHGNQIIERDFPLDEFPVFVKNGAIIPMDIKRSYNGFGTEENEGKITFVIYPEKENSFEFFHLDKPDVKTVISYKNTAVDLSIKVEGAALDYMLSIHFAEKPEGVVMDGGELEEGVDWFFDGLKERLVIRGDGRVELGVFYHIEHNR